MANPITKQHAMYARLINAITDFRYSYKRPKLMGRAIDAHDEALAIMSAFPQFLDLLRKERPTTYARYKELLKWK